MKILFSDNSLWGLLNFRVGIINHFISLGYQVTLVAPADDMVNYNWMPTQAKYIPIELSRTGTNPLNDIHYYGALKAIYKIERPDYIFHYTIKPNIYGTLAAKSLKIPSSAMIAGLGYVYTKGGVGNAIARIMYKYAMRFPERVMVLNKANYDTLSERKVVVPSKLLLLEGGEGIDLQKFSTLPYPDNEKPVFLMICRLLYEKGYTEYVTAAKALRGQAVFRLMGPIDSHPSAVKRSDVDADIASGAVEYIEYSPDVQSQITSADCIVLPSYHEGLSRVLMEALAFARPIITTDIAGCRETVDSGENGYMCEPKNAQSLTDAFTKFMHTSVEEKKEMGKASRKKAESQFNIEQVIEKYLQVIGKL